MKATYDKDIFFKGKRRDWGERTIELPFNRVSARALVVRRSDGAILGVRHQPGRGMALPGGGIEDGEDPPQALRRELAEEGITLIGADEGWQDKFGVDYYEGYKELNFWFAIAVDDAELTPNPEINEWAWVPQTENPWYPNMGAQIAVFIARYFPGEGE